MSTLKELKEWLEQGGKICRESSRDLVYDLTEEGELRDMGYRSATYRSLIASDWVKVDEGTRWKPAKEEPYYSVTRDGRIYCDKWDYVDIDKGTYAFYNCFKTEEEAEQARELWLAERELRSLADGGDWFIEYGFDEDNFIPRQFLLYTGSPYHFSTKEKADAAIEQLGKDKLKLIYGVK